MLDKAARRGRSERYSRTGHPIPAVLKSVLLLFELLSHCGIEGHFGVALTIDGPVPALLLRIRFGTDKTHRCCR